MAKEIRTRAVSRELYKNYFKKAEEFYRSMEQAYDAGNWNACVVNAIHCAISSADAMTVFYLGFRHASERHQDVLQLLQGIDFDPKEIQSKNRQLTSLLSIKNRAEYEERLMGKSDAENASKAAKRFHKWVKDKLG
jgi:HEPN domain-containing protein